MQTSGAADNWLELLFRACVVLNRTSDKTVRSISVTIPNNSPKTLHLLTVVCERLSKKYGFYSLVEQEEDYLSVRFSRSHSSKKSPQLDSLSRND